MLTTTSAFSGFSVDDLAAARTFYETTLGLAVTDNPMGAFELDVTGGAPIFVYAKDDHEPASYTVLNLVVPDIDAAVVELAAAGVELVRYGFDGQDADGVVRPTDPSQGPTIGWFLDPAGNTLSIIEG
jgi:catechol 2,3-dioxygenase-like lactoylglutathione lyase family enzyme